MCVTFGGIKQGGVELLLPPQQIRGRHGSNLLTQSWVLNRWLAAPAPVDAVGGRGGRTAQRRVGRRNERQRTGDWSTARDDLAAADDAASASASALRWWSWDGIGDLEERLCVRDTCSVKVGPLFLWGPRVSRTAFSFLLLLY